MYVQCGRKDEGRRNENNIRAGPARRKESRDYEKERKRKIRAVFPTGRRIRSDRVDRSDRGAKERKEKRWKRGNPSETRREVKE